MDGIINIFKPKGMTSFDVVAIVRKSCGIKKTGHLGTLDPMAEGVLPVAVGKATRIMDYLDTDIKVYKGRAILGIETDTLDIWGEKIAETEVSNVSQNRLKEVISGFCGVISQTPPIYSALKVNGKKLYEYARKGESVEIKSRDTFIKQAELISFDGREFEFQIACSKGTYIRTICSDIGKKLGCGAAMSSLTRLKSGCFDVSDSVSVEQIRNMPISEIKRHMTAVDTPLAHFGKALLSDWERRLFVNGVALRREQWVMEELPRFASEKFALPIKEEFEHFYRVYDRSGVFLGTAIETNGLIKADKVFYNANI